MIVTLDTEFTDFNNPRLISIGLAAKSGEEFYAELPVRPHECTEFVRDAVLPMLGTDPHAICEDDFELRTRLLTWLRLIRQRDPLQIVFDFETDWDLFVKATGSTVPEHCIGRLARANEQNELLRWDFWQQNPGLREHHALHDAKALLYSVRLK